MGIFCGVTSDYTARDKIKRQCSNRLHSLRSRLRHLTLIIPAHNEMNFRSYSRFGTGGHDLVPTSLTPSRPCARPDFKEQTIVPSYVVPYLINLNGNDCQGVYLWPERYVAPWKACVCDNIVLQIHKFQTCLRANTDKTRRNERSAAQNMQNKPSVTKMLPLLMTEHRIPKIWQCHPQFPCTSVSWVIYK